MNIKRLGLVGKYKLGVIFVALLAATTLAFAMGDKVETYSWRYKMTVTVDTPEGEVSGSAVREMGNGPMSPLSQNGNPAKVRGEAVVVDMGKRGVLFALISHKSDEEFYYTFRKYHFDGPATLEGSKTFASLPSGTKEVINPEKPSGYPKLVTFTDMNDPKSVTEAQVWESEFKTGLYFLKEDRMEKLFGKGVHLKDVTIEITDEPVTWGVVDRYLKWIVELRHSKARLSGNSGIAITTNDLADNLGVGSFSTGDSK